MLLGNSPELFQVTLFSEHPTLSLMALFIQVLQWNEKESVSVPFCFDFTIHLFRLVRATTTMVQLK